MINYTPRLDAALKRAACDKIHNLLSTLADYDVVTEIVPTERAAMFRFTFPQNANSYVLLDAFDKGSYVKIIPNENKIMGFTTKNSGGVPDNFINYFVIEFDKSFTYKSVVENGEIKITTLKQTQTMQVQ